MTSANTRCVLVLGLVGALAAACGGSIAPDLGSSSSSSSSSSGGSSSGGSSSGGSSSGGSSSGGSSSGGSSSGGSSSGGSSSGGSCVEGTLGDLCPWDCPYGPRARCTGGQWICPAPTPNCDICTGPVPDCKCGAATCDTATQTWTCSGACGSFACGKVLCVGGQMCTDHPPGVSFDAGGPQDFHSCDPLPPACAATPTCACVVAALQGGSSCTPSSCTDDGQGHVSVECLGI